MSDFRVDGGELGLVADALDLTTRQVHEHLRWLEGLPLHHEVLSSALLAPVEYGRVLESVEVTRSITTGLAFLHAAMDELVRGFRATMHVVDDAEHELVRLAQEAAHDAAIVADAAWATTKTVVTAEVEAVETVADAAWKAEKAIVAAEVHAVEDVVGWDLDATEIVARAVWNVEKAMWEEDVRVAEAVARAAAGAASHLWSYVEDEAHDWTGDGRFEARPTGAPVVTPDLAADGDRTYAQQPGDISRTFSNIATLEAAGDHDTVAVTEVATDPPTYRIELPGIHGFVPGHSPMNVEDAARAELSYESGYEAAVRKLIMGLPPGSQVMLVGHSQGGIVAMDLAHDPSINGYPTPGHVNITHVVTAGSPIDDKSVAPGSGTKVWDVTNTCDVVPRLEAPHLGAPVAGVQHVSFTDTAGHSPATLAVEGIALATQDIPVAEALAVPAYDSIVAWHSANLYATHLQGADLDPGMDAYFGPPVGGGTTSFYALGPPSSGGGW